MLATNQIDRPIASLALLGSRVQPLCLRMHGGPLDGREIRLESAKVSIGGAVGCTLRLRSPGSLPLYAWILRGPQGCLVRRFVPHVLLNGGVFDESPLHNGDRLRLGTLELEVLSGAQELAFAPASAADSERCESRAEEPTNVTTLRTDNGTAVSESKEPSVADPWARPFQRVFATRGNQASQQRRSLRQHLARRTRKLLKLMRRQEAEMHRLQQALAQQTADAHRPATSDQSTLDQDRVQLEEEARQLSLLVEQMSEELREAAAHRAGLSLELHDQCQLRDQIQQREAELARSRDEADEVRRSTAAQIEQLKHAFELVRQERDELALREEREAAFVGQFKTQIENLQAELVRSLDLRKQDQNLLDQAKTQLARLEHHYNSEQPQLQQRLTFLQNEIERRDQELAEAREAATSQNGKLLASLNQLGEELSELRSVRQREREQNAAEVLRLGEELSVQRTLLAQRESELRAARSNSESTSAELRTELDRIQAEANQTLQRATRDLDESLAARRQLEAALASLEEQLESRTAELKNARQEASTEAARSAKSIEQLRTELQSERTRRQEECEVHRSELEQAHQQANRERDEWAVCRQQFEADVASLEQQVERRTADWRTTQQTAAAEATQFGKTIEQLRQELQSERTLRQQEAESRQSDRQKFENELAAMRKVEEAHASEVADLNSKLATEVSRLTLQVDRAEREAEELRATLSGERTRWNEQLELLQQTIRQVTSDRELSQKQLDQVVCEASEMQQTFVAEQAKWAQEREELTALAAAVQAKEDVSAEQSAFDQPEEVADQQVLHHELQIAADQLNQLQDQNRQLLQQVADLRAELTGTQDRLGEVLGRLDDAAGNLPESGSSALEALAEGAVAQDAFAESQRQFEADKHDWQLQRETWESSLRQREEDLAAHVAELERQVGEWHARQEQEQGYQMDSAVAAIQRHVAPEPVYGSYTPAHAELPPDVTMPLPTNRVIVDFETPAEGSYGETMPVRFATRFDSEEASGDFPASEPSVDSISQNGFESSAHAAHESADEDSPDARVANASDEREPAEDPDSVDAVLGRLMQAGLWNAEAEDLSPSIDRTMVLGHEGEATYDACEAAIPNSMTEPGALADQDIGSTMDAASLMGMRGEAPRSWRAQLLGDESATASASETPAEEVLGYQPAPIQIHSEEPAAANSESELGEPLPQQAVGHGSWRAQLLGGDAAEPAIESGRGLASSDSNEESAESHEEEVPTFSPVAMSASAAAEPASDEEDSIEAYMSKLLKRVRGDNVEPNWSAPAAPAPVVEAKAVPTPTVKPTPAAPIEAGEFVPQRQAPEASVSLAAMREIANAASRVAIDTHAKRNHSKRSARRLLKAALALFTTAGFAVWGCYGGGVGPWCGVVVGMLLMAWWSLQSIWHMTRAMRLKPALTVTDTGDSAELLAEGDAAATSEAV